MPPVLPLGPADADSITDVLLDAFRDYPVMRYVLGDGPGYPERLRTLIGFFVAARVLRGEPLYGIRAADGTLAGAAIMSWTAPTVVPEELERRREATWAELGAAERARYEEYGAAASGCALPAPHWHLNMIGVRRASAGQGLGRLLLDAVHRHSDSDPRSPAVSLTTETRENVALYQHVGYRVVGQARVSEGLETWGMAR